MPEHWLRLQGAQTIQTRDFLDTQEVLDDAAACSGIAMILGESGLGKTHATSYWRENATLPTIHLRPTATTTARRFVADATIAVSRIDEEPSGTEFTLADRLVAELGEQPWLWILDEAQWLKKALKSIRGFWMTEGLQLGLAFVGGPEFESLLEAEPMLNLRSVQRVRFNPLSQDDLLEVLPAYHPIYAEADPKLLLRINREYANGRFRLWANFTRLAATRCLTEDRASVTRPIADDLLRRL